jgi:hypothetical protein
VAITHESWEERREPSRTHRYRHDRPSNKALRILSWKPDGTSPKRGSGVEEGIFIINGGS